MEYIKKKLDLFEPISLNSMDSVKLMNRTDTKFLFHISKIPQILDALKNDYLILEIEGNRICSYETLYYDTKNFDLYMKHHNGRLNRYKVRCRKYVESDINFFEIKYKNNKSRTIKKRIKIAQIENILQSEAANFLHKHSNIEADSLFPVCWVNYARITLVNKNFQERLTLDIGLEMKKEDQYKQIESLVIAELKQDRSTEKSIFNKVMQENRIQKNSMSKYCLGVSLLYPTIKQNRFKPKLLTLKKLLYATL
jgi:hypothetical protein